MNEFFNSNSSINQKKISGEKASPFVISKQNGFTRNSEPPKLNVGIRGSAFIRGVPIVDRSNSGPHRQFNPIIAIADDVVVAAENMSPYYFSSGHPSNMNVLDFLKNQLEYMNKHFSQKCVKMKVLHATPDQTKVVFKYAVTERTEVPLIEVLFKNSYNQLPITYNTLHTQEIFENFNDFKNRFEKWMFEFLEKESDVSVYSQQVD